MDGEVVSTMMKSLKDNLMDIYEWYVACEGVHGSSQVSTDESLSSFSTNKDSSSSMSDSRLSRFLKKQAIKNSAEIKNDVERYLLDARESIESKDFDVLDWWKVNKKLESMNSKLSEDDQGHEN
ncbi:Hypothetical predicted protein [Olea europaea subsp. europaea]|uniref:Uncharacterized protein n=1 Tax=Olea europaea subsp. europaea TaxID=158383 RepID=A0A8S0QH25_OLEEU|nr:Hypothetical predicted protein [Olea europaea subsp. europaea]